MNYPRNFTIQAFVGICLASAAVLTAGCAVGNPPIDLMSRADAALNQAEQSGAGQHAPLELKFARQKYAEAQAAVNREEYDQARRLASEALVNAELAEAKADAAQARAAAQEVRRAVSTLRDELQRMETEQ